jgi:hypothetical protein
LECPGFKKRTPDGMHLAILAQPFHSGNFRTFDIQSFDMTTLGWFAVYQNSTHTTRIGITARFNAKVRCLSERILQTFILPHHQRLDFLIDRDL